MASAGASSAGATACLQSGPYAGKDAASAETALKAALPAGAWSVSTTERAGEWMLFMGRFVDNEARVRKEGELKRRNAPFEEIDAPPEFARGLSLGRFTSRQDADKGLAELNRLGVHTARIVTFTQPATLRTFKIDKADNATADKLRTLKLAQPVTACGASAAP